MEFRLSDHPHRRLNPLTREWVLVSPHRARRPWQGQTEPPVPERRPAFDPTCYLCPGNVRANGERNPRYEAVYTFTNDFPALLPDTPLGGVRDGSLISARAERGLCKVICFSPAHNLTLARMSSEEIERVVREWTAQYLEIGEVDFVRHVQIFENKGAMMGCSNPHPHGQIWATESIPALAAREIESQEEYLHEHGSCLLCDYVHDERRLGARTVAETEQFLAVVPFWAVWPFEILAMPRAHRAALPDLSTAEQADLARLLRRLTACYDRLFDVSFPYSMGIHQAPTTGDPQPGCHMHLHFYPPLLRSAEVRKFMVGYEMLGEPQRDITPEDAAERLRELVPP